MVLDESGKTSSPLESLQTPGTHHVVNDEVNMASQTYCYNGSIDWRMLTPVKNTRMKSCGPSPLSPSATSWDAYSLLFDYTSLSQDHTRCLRRSIRMLRPGIVTTRVPRKSSPRSHSHTPASLYEVLCSLSLSLATQRNINTESTKEVSEAFLDKR